MSLFKTLSSGGFHDQKTSSKGKENVSKSKNVSPDEKAARYEELKSKRAWDMAISPAKQLPMQLVMVYFSGGGVQIFSMGMVAMLLASPFKAVAGMNEGACTDNVFVLSDLNSPKFSPNSHLQALQTLGRPPPFYYRNWYTYCVACLLLPLVSGNATRWVYYRSAPGTGLPLSNVVRYVHHLVQNLPSQTRLKSPLTWSNRVRRSHFIKCVYSYSI